MRIDNDRNAFREVCMDLLKERVNHTTVIGYNFKIEYAYDDIAVRTMWDTDTGEIYKWQLITIIGVDKVMVQEQNDINGEKVLTYITDCAIIEA